MQLQYLSQKGLCCKYLFSARDAWNRSIFGGGLSNGYSCTLETIFHIAGTLASAFTNRESSQWVFPGDDNLKIVNGNVDELTAYNFNNAAFTHRVGSWLQPGGTAKADREQQVLS